MNILYDILSSEFKEVKTYVTQDNESMCTSMEHTRFIFKNLSQLLQASTIDILNLYHHDDACTFIVTSSIAVGAKLVHQESVLG